MSEPTVCVDDRATDVDLADPELYEHGDPDAVWARLRAVAPVYRNPGRSGPWFWALTRYRDALTVYRDAATFSSERGMVLAADIGAGDPASQRMLVVTDPPRHPKVRKIVNGAFTARMMRRLEDRVRALVNQLLDRAMEAGECDFVDDVAARLPVAIICELLGVPPADQDWMYHLTSTAFGGGDPSDSRNTSRPDRAAAYADILSYYQEIADERRRLPREDLVTTLVQGVVDGEPLEVEEVMLNCTNLIIGGNETTRHAASGGLLALAERDAQWRRLRTDPDVLSTAVEEILRWTTPGMHVLRTATRDVTIADQPVAAGETIVVWNASANRDEDMFENPQVFDVARSPNRHIAFGQGEHFCLGGALARIELSVLFGELRDRVSRVEVCGPVRRTRSPVLRGIRNLPVRLAA